MPAEQEPPYRLGCPAWACEAWVGSLYSTKDRRRWLGEYSRVFGTVEGNTTFYAMPSRDVVARWAGEAEPGFRFALKTPAEITHERQLADAEAATAEWVGRLRILEEAGRLGPTLLQLPPYFSGSQLPDLRRFLERWPAELPLAVEPRHDDYFDSESVEGDFDALLCEYGADRAIFDSRALFQASPDDETEAASQHRKPNPPGRLTVTGERPFVRFIGRNNLALADKWIAEWAGVVAGWIRDGREPYFFCHAPDNDLAPLFAERFHAAVRERLPTISSLPDWLGRLTPKQQALF